MKVSLNWIKEYVALPEDMDLSRLAYDLTMATVEVEGVTNLADEFQNIIVGVITEVLPHPNAEKLRICKPEYQPVLWPVPPQRPPKVPDRVQS